MDTIDDIGRRAAAVLAADIDATLDVDALFRDLADTVAEPRGARRKLRAVPSARRPRWWAAWGAAAAVAAAVVGAIVVIANREPTRDIVPAPSVPPSPVPTATPTTAPMTTTPGAPSTAPTTANSLPTTDPTVRPPASGDGLAVSYLDPPPFLEPQIIGSVGSPGAEAADGIVATESGIVSVAYMTATVIGWDGSTRTVGLRPDIEVRGWIVLAAGPDDVLYAVATGIDDTNATAAAILAIPLSGPRAGEVVATTPTDINGMIERQVGWVGHGPTGLVDRDGRLGEIAPYVDRNGDPLTAPPGIPEYRRNGDEVARVEGTQRWPLRITRASRSGDPYLGPAAAAPAPGGGAVVWDWIGPRSSDGDYAMGSMPVVAFLAPDGSATWRRLPDGWGVVAADVWGTVLARRNGTGVELALATSVTAVTTAVTAAQQTVTDYLTALASRDYDAAAALLGNDGLSLSERPDLAPMRASLLESGDLAGALEAWCETDGAACWMPAQISGGEPPPAGVPRPHGIDVVADYTTAEFLDGGPRARFVVSSWEGQPTVFGLPPLHGPRGAQTARDALGVQTLAVDGPDYVGGVWIATPTGTESVGAPVRGIDMHAASSDGETITWAVGDPVHSVVTGMSGAVVCDVEGWIAEIRGGLGAYRAVVEYEVEAGPQDDPAPRTAVEIDCASGAETPIDPISWNGGPIDRRLLTVSDRTFTLTSTDHHGELVSEAGVELGSDDPLVGAPAFSADGTVVVYPTIGGVVPANPNVSTRLVAVDTSTGERLWERVLPTDIAAVFVTTGRVIVSTRADVSGVYDDRGQPSPPAALTAVDLATGEILATVPATLDVIHVS